MNMPVIVQRNLLLARSATALALAIPALLVMAPTIAQAQVSVGLDIRIGYAPPPIPVFAQPPLPGPDYIWIPGHWAWSDWVDDYYWVQGYWELPPELGLLWTPAWWGWDRGGYRYHDGYWGNDVGWYGGIDYGFGYHGHGWEGGRWQNGHLAYNRAVVNLSNARVPNVYYQQTTAAAGYGPRTSYAGGAGGIQARPTPQEWRATQGPHYAPTWAQQQRVQQAATNPRNVASNVTPQWQPPAVRRIGNDGAPIDRSATLRQGGANAAAPSQYPRPAPNYAPQMGYGQSPRPSQGQVPTPMTTQNPAPQMRGIPAPQTLATPQRPAMVNQAPRMGYGQVPRPLQTPTPITTPSPAQPMRTMPAPGAFQPAPQAQPRVAPAPAPRPQAPAQPRQERHEHQ